MPTCLTDMKKDIHKRLTVLVDMDDTIENLCETWVQCLNEEHGTTVELNDIHSWAICDAFPSLTKEAVFAPLRTTKLWERVKPLPGAVEYLKRLIDDGHRVAVVTASHHETVAKKLNLVLFKYFPYLTYQDVIIASQKDLIRGDVLVDDGIHNFTGDRKLKLLMTAAHNRDIDEGYEIKRVNDWPEIYREITNFAIANDYEVKNL